MYRQQLLTIRKNATIASRKLRSFWSNYGHPAFHYSLIPGIFAFGLYQAGQLSMNPLVLAENIFVP